MDLLKSIEQIFEYKEISERKVKLAAVQLKDQASAWWAKTKAIREQCTKKKVKTWEKMKSLISEAFWWTMQSPFHQLQHVRQGDHSVEENAEFHHLVECNNLNEFREKLVIRWA